MDYKLFIDDERYPVTPDWFIARNSYDAIYAVKTYGLPSEIAFDHDLGGRDTSMAFLYALSDYMIDNNLKFPSGFKYSIHSQNPVGAKNIDVFMMNLMEYLND